MAKSNTSQKIIPAEIARHDDFDVILEHLETLQNIKSKLAFLIEEETKWARTATDWDNLPILSPSFGAKCQLEIKKYERLLKLEKDGLVSQLQKPMKTTNGIPGYYTMDQLQQLDFIRLKKETELKAELDFKAEHKKDEHVPLSDEPDVPNKFTRKQTMALLDAFSPEFKNADNVVKAAFIVKLTPYIGERNIAQEYSYLRHDDYNDLVEDWGGKFRKSGRGRKKKTT